MQSSTDTVTSSDEILTGRVKWFNNKTGYGFITVTDGSRTGTDVFAHHSSIVVGSQQYKYLVQGEYVEFTLSKTSGGAHEFQATNICGIKSGQLMCETRNEVRNSRTTHNSLNVSETNLDLPLQQESNKKPVRSRKVSPTQPTRSRGEGPRDGDKKGWTVVGKGDKTDTKPKGRVARHASE
jgi:cold shock CspA family protein